MSAQTRQNLSIDEEEAEKIECCAVREHLYRTY
jgi:hypothetical protein